MRREQTPRQRLFPPNPTLVAEQSIIGSGVEAAAGIPEEVRDVTLALPGAAGTVEVVGSGAHEDLPQILAGGYPGAAIVGKRQFPHLRFARWTRRAARGSEPRAAGAHAHGSLLGLDMPERAVRADRCIFIGAERGG